MVCDGVVAMDDDSQAHLEVLRRSHQRRLQVLEKQAATSGISTPPQIITEIEDIRSAIANIDQQLASTVLPGGVPQVSTTKLPVRQRSLWLLPTLGGAGILLALIVALSTRGGSGG